MRQPEMTARQEYREGYLRTDHWQMMRRLALEAAGNRCQACNGTSRLDVHHRTYERRGAESLQDLTVLCRECHNRFHARSVWDQVSRERTEAAAGRIALCEEHGASLVDTWNELANAGFTRAEFCMAMHLYLYEQAWNGEAVLGVATD